MTRNILLILLGFMTGMLADATLFKLPRLQECYETTSEIMDVVDYYSLMLTRSLDTCEELVDENVDLIRRHRDLAVRNAEIIEQCRVRGINIKND
jgi:DNA-binding Lrp family transcriptional regulator